MKRAILLLLFISFLLSNSFSQNKVGPLMTSTWQTFQWPFNAAFPNCSSGIYGEVNNHLGNACGPTAIAKLLHYHRHPVYGEGSYRMTDKFNISHSINFENTYYKWNLMRDEFSSSATEEEYMPTAELVYHAYGMMEDPDNTGRSIYDVCNLLKRHMRYSSSAYVAYRFDYSRQDYINLLKAELDAGRPLLIESWTSGSTPPGESGNHAGHYWNIDGYDEQDRFHVVWNNGYWETWIDIDGMDHPDYDAYYMWALIQAKPDDTGKKFMFTTPSDRHMFKMNESVNLSWEHQNISNINIDFSYDGNDWITIAENIPTAPGSWTWAGPDQYSKNASIRIRDTENEYYDFYFDGFETYEQKKLSLLTPVGGDEYESGTKLCVAWDYDGISKVKLECKESNSESWEILERELMTTKRFNVWPLPSGAGNSYDFRLSSEDQTFVEIVEGVKVVNEQQTGGPYKKDYHTLMLMHLDNDIKEECYQPEIIINGLAPQFDYSAPGKGAALYLDNSDRSYQSYLEIPHEDFLALRGSFTVDLWFKINSWDNTNTNKPSIISKPSSGSRSNYSLIGNASNGSVLFKVRTTAGGVVVECKHGIIVPGVWYHAAMLHDQNTRELKLQIHNKHKERIDEQTGSYPEGAGILVGTTSLLIGKKTVGSSYLDGCVDEIRISRTVRDFNAAWSGLEDEISTNNIRIKVYPNPASNKINIKIDNQNIRIQKISIVDINGKLVYMPEEAKQYQFVENISINTSNLRRGIYFVVLEMEEGRLVEKVIVN